jgi:hypothetical protein
LVAGLVEHDDDGAQLFGSGCRHQSQAFQVLLTQLGEGWDLHRLDRAVRTYPLEVGLQLLHVAL